jgi:hypothetical protein
VLNSNSKTNFNLSGTLTVAGNTTLSGGTANGVAYLNASKVLTTGSALTFDGTNLGIGTSSPVAPLHVYKASSSSVRVDTDVSASTTQLNFAIAGVNKWSLYRPGSSADLRMFDNVNTSDVMTWQAGGNVGIGTTSPSSKLDVSSSVGSTPAYNNATVKVISTATAAVGTGSSIVFSGQTGNSTASYAFAGIQGVKGSATAGDYSGSLLFLTQNSGGGSLLTEAARIDSSGNLGLGVTPSAWSTGKAFQFGVYGVAYDNNVGFVTIGSNFYYNAGDKYKATDVASKYVQGAGTHAWYTAPSGTAGNAITFTQAMTLDASGNLLVGTTSNPNTARIYARYDTLTTQPLINSATIVAASTSWNHFVGQSGNGSSITTNNIFIRGNGNIENANNSYGAISDVKLKENIVDATPKLDKLLQVRVVNYNLIGEPDNKQLGVVAQELEQVFPAMVSESADIDADGNDLGTTTKSVKYSVFVPMLIKAMQEQQALIESLTARLNALENK